MPVRKLIGDSNAVSSWWRQNRRWAVPTGFLAVVLPILSIAGCAGAVLTLVFAAVKIGTSFKKRTD
jgi:hypothetical protein